MKRILIIAIMMIMVMGVYMQAEAALQNLGTDSLGNRLIYDTDFDITWYDYSKFASTWANQVDWALALSVTFGSNTYTDWRLPTTVDGAYVYGVDGTTTAGYNITSSEMGHLFYTELGNQGYYDTSGIYVGDGNWGLNNTGDFQNLQTGHYWSGTEYSTDPARAWGFHTNDGNQNIGGKGYAGYGIAVRPGLAVVPEPISSILFITGGATLGFRRYWKRKREGI